MKRTLLPKVNIVLWIYSQGTLKLCSVKNKRISATEIEIIFFLCRTESRMKKALRGLLETPQNNFKIFQVPTYSTSFWTFFKKLV